MTHSGQFHKETFIIAIYDENQFYQLSKIFEYLTGHCQTVNLYINHTALYLQAFNQDMTICFDLTLPSTWFNNGYGYYYLDPTIPSIILSIIPAELNNILNTKCPNFISLSYSINAPGVIIINSEESYYDYSNEYNVIMSPEDCYALLATTPAPTWTQPTQLPRNDNYHYHLSIDTLEMQSIIQVLTNRNYAEMEFHTACNTVFDEVILFSKNEKFTILQNENSLIMPNNFITTVKTALLCALPLFSFTTSRIFIFPVALREKLAPTFRSNFAALPFPIDAVK